MKTLAVQRLASDVGRYELALEAYATAFGRDALGWPMTDLSWGLFVRPSRHFLPGDVVIVWWSNGQGARQPVIGYSSKRGACMRSLYVKIGRHGGPSEFTPAGPLQLLELPDHIAALRLDAPDARAFVLEGLRAARAAVPVSSDSGDF